jgi:hypothetical protein
MVTKITFLLILLLTLSAQAISAQRHVNIGLQNHSITYDWDGSEPVDTESSASDYSIGVGILNQLGQNGRHHLGFGLDIQNILDNRMLGVRAVDYQYHAFKQFRIGAFIGAATVDTGASQNGYYLGANAAWMDLMQNVDLVVELRRADGLARDTLPSDNLSISRPDIFMDVNISTVLIRWRF